MDEVVAFVGFAEPTRQLQPRSKIASALASTRLRVLIPGAVLARTARVYLVSFDDFVADPLLARLGAVRAIVLRKLATSEIAGRGHQLHYLLELLREAGRQARVVADLSDDYAAAPHQAGFDELAEYQRELLKSCAITVPCQALAGRLAGEAVHGISVVEDPYEAPERGPRAPGSSPLRLCWFGNAIDLAPLDKALRAIAAGMPATGVRVEAVTARSAAAALQALGSELGRAHPGFQLRFTEWSLPAQHNALAACDLVLLPQDAGPWGRVKSHNRLVEALRAGRLAIASPIPSYQELAEHAWIGEDAAAGVAWALGHPDDALRRIEGGQAYVRARFSPEAVGAKWREVLGLRSG